MLMKLYIPKTKDDVNAIYELEKHQLFEVKQDVKILLEWMQDMHWDVSMGIVNYFKNNVNQIEDEIIEILNSNDEEWKYNILYFLIKDINGETLSRKLEDEIQRIAYKPNLTEIDEELNILALNILKPDRLDML
jgi:hypothetical protein